MVTDFTATASAVNEKYSVCYANKLDSKHQLHSLIFMQGTDPKIYYGEIAYFGFNFIAYCMQNWNT